MYIYIYNWGYNPLFPSLLVPANDHVAQVIEVSGPVMFPVGPVIIHDCSGIHEINSAAIGVAQKSTMEDVQFLR